MHFSPSSHPLELKITTWDSFPRIVFLGPLCKTSNNSKRQLHTKKMEWHINWVLYIFTKGTKSCMRNSEKENIQGFKTDISADNSHIPACPGFLNLDSTDSCSQKSLLWGPALCIMVPLVASLTSTHWMPEAPCQLWLPKMYLTFREVFQGICPHLRTTGTIKDGVIIESSTL